MDASKTKSIRAWFSCFLVAALCLFARTSGAADNPSNGTTEPNCGLKMLGSLDLGGTQGALVPIMIDSKPAWMVLLTSSAGSYVFDTAAEKFGWKRRSLNTSSKVAAGGVEMTQSAEIEKLRVGKIVYNSATVLVYPSKSPLPYYQTEPIIGAFGMDMLADVDFEFDLARKKLNLFSTDHCPGKVVYWTNDYASAPLLKGRLGDFYFPMELDGKLIEATFDAQSQSSSLTTDLTKKLYDFDQHSHGNEKVEDKNGNTFYYYRAMQITAPGLTISNAKIQLTDGRMNCRINKKNSKSKAAGYEERCMGAYPLQLGFSVMQQLRIYFATKEKRVYYTSADAGR